MGKQSDGMPLDFFASYRFSLMNTEFLHKMAHECACYHITSGQRLVIDVVIVSPDLRPYVLGSQVRRGPEL